MEKLLIAFLALLFGAFVVLPGAAYFAWADSYVMWKIWGWHLASLGFLPGLGWKHFFAVSCILGLLRRRPTSEPPEKEQTNAQKIGRLVALTAVPWFTLFVAWIFT